MMTSIIIGQSQRDKETREPDDAISITSGSEEGREKRPAMDLARGLSSARWADDGSLWQAFVASVRQSGGRATPPLPHVDNYLLSTWLFVFPIFLVQLFPKVLYASA